MSTKWDRKDKWATSLTPAQKYENQSRQTVILTNFTENHTRMQSKIVEFMISNFPEVKVIVEEKYGKKNKVFTYDKSGNKKEMKDEQN